MITVIDGDTIKGTLYISAVIHTAVNILCEKTYFKRNYMFCVIASVAWLEMLQITVIEVCIYSEHHVIEGVKNLHMHGVAD